MSKSPKTSGEKPVEPRPSPAILLLKDIGDTTWRMFVPTIGLMLLGMWADSNMSSTPWLMIAGLVIGTALSVVLVRRQLKKVQENS